MKTQLGHYDIVSELGRGGMGVVYKGFEASLNRYVAIKVLADSLAHDASVKERFLREARSMASLNDPHIIQIYFIGDDFGQTFFVMEFVDGESLGSVLKREGKLKPEQAAKVICQTAMGLSTAHDKGVIHRDIKPGNIMILPRGQAKIMDFGIARMRSADFKTSTGIVMGTPRFMSPEQVAGEPVDHRSDIFSLGVVLFEMITGTALFAGEDTPQIAHNVTSVEHTPPSRLNPDVPSMLDFAVARALKKDPAVRYQDAYEFAVDLRTCLAELRSRETAGKKGDKEGTRTVKIDSTADRAPLAPAARSIASDTQLPLSKQFDSFAAIQRLTAPHRRDRKLLQLPRPVGFLRRVSVDAGPRLLFLTSLVAAAAGFYVALG
jgi:serine/threonine-protein kinase